MFKWLFDLFKKKGYERLVRFNDGPMQKLLLDSEYDYDNPLKLEFIGKKGDKIELFLINRTMRGREIMLHLYEPNFPVNKFFEYIVVNGVKISHNISNFFNCPLQPSQMDIEIHIKKLTKSKGKKKLIRYSEKLVILSEEGEDIEFGVNPYAAPEK